MKFQIESFVKFTTRRESVKLLVPRLNVPRSDFICKSDRQRREHREYIAVASMRTTSSSTRCRALTTASTAKARPGMLIGMVWVTHWPVATIVMMATEVGETSVCARVSGFFGSMFCTP